MLSGHLLLLGALLCITYVTAGSYAAAACYVPFLRFGFDCMEIVAGVCGLALFFTLVAFVCTGIESEKYREMLRAITARARAQTLYGTLQ